MCFSNPKIQKSQNPKFPDNLPGNFGFLDFWIFVFLCFWIFGFLDFGILGFLDSWIFGYLDFWIYGDFMIFRIRGWLIFVLLFLTERRATIQMYPYQNFKCVLPTRIVNTTYYKPVHDSHTSFVVVILTS